MPGFADTAVIVFLALMLFGPKKLPVLARELGKWMAEFRRASNEFKMQMEEELRVAEQADKEKKIEAIEAAAPATPDPAAEPAATTPDEPWEVHPHLAHGEEYLAREAELDEANAAAHTFPIATSGELSIMPPATGLPIAQDAAVAEDESISDLVESIPEVQQTAIGPTGLSADGTRRAPAPTEPVTHG